MSNVVQPLTARSPSPDLLRHYRGHVSIAGVAGFLLVAAGVYFAFGWTKWLGLFVGFWLTYSSASLALAALDRIRTASAQHLWQVLLVAIASVCMGAALATALRLAFGETLPSNGGWIVRQWAASVMFGLVMIALDFSRLNYETNLQRWFRQRERAKTDAATIARQLTEAKLQVLQAQVEPHFLYNMMANVQQLVRTDPSRADAVLTSLITYLRSAVPQMREGNSTMRREVALARAYLDVMQVRLGERLTFEIKLPGELADVECPPSMLISLVENAIKHGLEPIPAGGHLSIEAAKSDGAITLRVTDDGAGFTAKDGSGVGLSNIRERLKSLYGDKASLDITPNETKGVTASITFEAA
jgi:sensor histidine kinase YesM